MNRTGKTNAKQGPMADYNAYKDFHDREFEAHVLASFMTFSGMKTAGGNLLNYTKYLCCMFENKCCI